ncbi:MAG TPA: hypothetical protein VGR35_08900 [Tepidisphaeraceae bacterium]|nr:hypothetical protein [Tepidisphaeraceae bacterium]
MSSNIGRSRITMASCSEFTVTIKRGRRISQTPILHVPATTMISSAREHDETQ